MRTDAPTISAVIIARNEQATIRRCVQSVLDQSVSVSEIIVVDGNSTDGTPRYVSDLSSRHNVIRLITEDSGAVERGPAAARNTGAAASSGELLLFINGDVTIGPDYVLQLLSLMNEVCLDAVAGLRWNVRSSLVSGLMNVHYVLNYNSQPQSLSSPAFLSGDALLIKAERFWNVGGYDPRMPAGEDADLGYRLRGAGGKLGYSKQSTIWHEGRHYRSFGDWFEQIEWYGRGAAALARAHSWRLNRERDGFKRHLLLPISAMFSFLLIVIVVGNAIGPLTWAVGALGFTVAGIKYLRSAARVQQVCASSSLPTAPLPQDIVLYPLFRFARYGLLSAYTWRALVATEEADEAGQQQQTEDSAH